MTQKFRSAFIGKSPSWSVVITFRQADTWTLPLFPEKAEQLDLNGKIIDFTCSWWKIAVMQIWQQGFCPCSQMIQPRWIFFQTNGNVTHFNVAGSWILDLNYSSKINNLNAVRILSFFYLPYEHMEDTKTGE